jgi:uncharacterized repeat protein (TIGR03803 family)
VGTIFKVNTDGSGFATLHNFRNSDGAQPETGLILSGDTLYGTALAGGDLGDGIAFAVNTGGDAFATLHTFAGGAAGAKPNSDLVLSDGSLYGMSSVGGALGGGSVFTVKTNGTGFTNLYSFPPPANPSLSTNRGVNSRSKLVVSGNTLYGAAFQGGDFGYGSVFAMNTDGSAFTNLYVFKAVDVAGSGTNLDGAGPNGLILSGGTLYGAAKYWGPAGNGTVFSVRANGSGFHVLHGFAKGSGFRSGSNNTNYDGANPNAGLVLFGDALYGTAERCGAAGDGAVFSVRTDGSGFTSVYTFTNGLDGANPAFGLILSGNTLFGGTLNGGPSGHGTLFSVKTDGSDFTTLYSFTNGPDGANPVAGLVLSGNTFYGTATGGGYLGLGSVYSLSFPPKLVATTSEAALILAWPTNYAGFDYTGYSLQSTTDLLSPPAWSGVPGSPVIVNGQSSVSTPLAGTRRFFRLSH